METRRTAGEEDGRQADESIERMKNEEVSALDRIEQPAPGSPSLIHL